MADSTAYVTWRAWLALLLVVPWLLVAPAGARERVSISRLKASFIYKFAQLVTWPEAALGDPGDPISLCVLGPDPFDDSLEEVVAVRRVHGRAFAVRWLREPPSATSCHLLYVAPEAAEKAGRMLDRLDNAATLTISETAGFAERGGIIRLFVGSRRIRFEINRAAAKRAGLEISSDLLRLATAVHE